MLVVVVEHERADAQRRRVRGRHRDRGHRRELVAEVVGHEQRRVAEVLELARLVAPRRRRRRVARPARRSGTAWSCCSLLSGEARDDRRERRRSIRRRRRCTTSASARAAASSDVDDLVVGADERHGGASRASSSDDAERARHRLRRSPSASSVTCTKPTSVWISRSSNRVARGVAHPRELLVGRRGRQRLRGVSGEFAVARPQVRVDADDLRLARREREDLRPAAADEERRMRPLHRLGHAVELGRLGSARRGT